MDEIAVLEFCCGELKKRADETDRQDAWFWSIRLKVAQFSLAMRRRYGDESQDALQHPLIPDDQNFLLASHPLLMRPESRPSMFQPDREWIEDLRRRTTAYLNSAQAIGKRRKPTGE